MLNKKKGFVLLIGLLMMFTLSACNDSEPSENSEAVAVARVNDEPIYESDWQVTVDRLMANYEQQGADLESEQGQMLVQQIETQALEQLIQQTVLYQHADDNGYVIDDDVAQSELDKLKANYENDTAFEAALETNMFTEDQLLETFKIELSINAYFDEHVEEVNVSDLEKMEFYQNYKAESEEQGQPVEIYSEVEDQIEQQIINNKQQEQINDLVESLMESSDIERLL